MKIDMIIKQLGEHLLTRPGWHRHPQNPHRFRHAAADVDVVVYRESITILFGRIEGPQQLQQQKAVMVSTRYYPATAIISVLELAELLVAARCPEPDRPDPA